MTNTQALAYAALALHKLGYGRDQIHAAMIKMEYLFDVCTEQEAQDNASELGLF